MGTKQCRGASQYRNQSRPAMKVTVAIHEHRTGQDTVRVFTDPEAATRWRIEMAKQDWDSEMGDRPMPADDNEMADAYWERQNDCCIEWFRSEEVEVETP